VDGSRVYGKIVKWRVKGGVFAAVRVGEEWEK